MKREEYFVQMAFKPDGAQHNEWAIVAPLTGISGAGYDSYASANSYILSRKNTKNVYRILKRVITEEVI